MSEENFKVCCNCRHNIRTENKYGSITCRCDIDNDTITYTTVMTYWCRHWAKDREVKNNG